MHEYVQLRPTTSLDQTLKMVDWADMPRRAFSRDTPVMKDGMSDRRTLVLSGEVAEKMEEEAQLLCRRWLALMRF